MQRIYFRFSKTEYIPFLNKKNSVFKQNKIPFLNKNKFRFLTQKIWKKEKTAAGIELEHPNLRGKRSIQSATETVDTNLGTSHDIALRRRTFCV